MTKRTFLIPTLLLAGFGSPVAAQEVELQYANLRKDDDTNNASAISLFRQDRPVHLAGHSSHRSHSSHSSHRSSSGGSGRGGYYPVYSPPPPPPPPPRSRIPSNFFSVPDGAAPKASNYQDGFTQIAKRVQTGLKSFGYYSGEIDGFVGHGTREGLIKLQTDYSLKITGTITPEVLRALQIETGP